MVSLFVPLLLILGSAGLYGLSFGPHGRAELAWVCLVPFFLGLRRVGARAALALGWLSGVVMAYTITDFLPRSVTVYYQQTPLFGALLFVTVVSLMCCPSHMLFALWYRSSRRPRGISGPLFVAAAWVAAEYLRGSISGNPWGTLGYTQASVKPIIQIADLTGVYGVSFLIVAVNAGVAASFASATVRWRGIAGLAVASLLVVANLGYGIWRLDTFSMKTPAVPVAVVQENLDLGARWRREMYGANLEAYLRRTIDAIESHSPALVVWPENAMTFFLEDEPLYQLALARVLSSGPAQLLSGGPSKISNSAEGYYNSAFVVSAQGRIESRYDKQYLVPFAEYFPFSSIGYLNRRFGLVRQFSSGTRIDPVPTAAGRAAMATCNEILYPEVVGARVRAGADYIVNLANDAWLGDPKYSARMLDVNILRGVEQRRHVVRAASSGISAVIDPTGTVKARTQPFTAAVIHGEIAPGGPLTVYGRVGDAFVLACALATVGTLLPRRRGAA